MDKIKIKNLKVFAYHGVYEKEKEAGQNFYVNAVLYTDTVQAGKADDLEFSTNYGEVCCFIDRYMKEHTFDLIETVAERTAEAVLLEFPRIKEVKLEICKPEAPIELPFESVSVEIIRKWHMVYLSVGSNLGDKEGYIRLALDRMKKEAKIRVLQISELISTKPYGDTATEEFLNGAIEIETLFSPEELLFYIHETEAAANRERLIHWGNRTLDLDILFYDDIVMSTDTLTIPHIDMVRRDFVLAPLSQIAPYFMHPLYKKTVKMLLEDMEKSTEKYVL